MWNDVEGAVLSKRWEGDEGADLTRTMRLPPVSDRWRIGVIERARATMCGARESCINLPSGAERSLFNSKKLPSVPEQKEGTQQLLPCIIGMGVGTLPHVTQPGGARVSTEEVATGRAAGQGECNDGLAVGAGTELPK